MPINPAGSLEALKRPVTLGSGRRKGRPRKLLLSPCRSCVSPVKATEVIHRTRKQRSNNTITNYFPSRRVPPPAVVLEAAERPPAPPAEGPAAAGTPPDQGRARRPGRLPPPDETCDMLSAGRPEEPASSPRTPVSPHKIQSLNCEPLAMIRVPAVLQRRSPLSPALNFNKPKLSYTPEPIKPARNKRPCGGPAGAAPLPAAADSNRKLTEYFPIRRSNRRTKRALDEERAGEIRRRLARNRDEGLKVALFPGKGRGVVATRPFSRGEFVVEYAGTLVEPEEARRRERLYAQDQNTGCYMYYFTCKDRNWCIDGTPETPRLGRLVNHSRHHNNCVTRSIEVDGLPRLVLIARHDIAAGDEILYDYGDRSKESLKHHPWLAL